MEGLDGDRDNILALIFKWMIKGDGDTDNVVALERERLKKSGS